MRAAMAALKCRTRDELVAEQRAVAPGWSDAEIGRWADAEIIQHIQQEYRKFYLLAFRRLILLSGYLSLDTFFIHYAMLGGHAHPVRELARCSSIQLIQLTCRIGTSKHYPLRTCTDRKEANHGVTRS